MLKNWLREPLLHFLVIGGALFLLYGLQNDGLVDEKTQITIDEADINRLSRIWQKKMQRPPTQAELDGMIERQVREEVMYREALTMGLDKNDTIVRRRLAQKIGFISADLATQIEPTEKELSDYFAAHPKKFETPAHISFSQIYFNSDRRGKQAENDATDLLNKLNQPDSAGALQADISKLGDPFMVRQTHEQVNQYETSRLFGKMFADKLFSLTGDDWQGPIWSGYGLHLVRIDNKTPALQPTLNSVREKVRNEWFAQQRRTIKENFYQSLRQRYEIIIDDITIINKTAKNNIANTKQ